MSENTLLNEKSSKLESAYIVGRQFYMLRDGLQALLVIKRTLGKDFILANSNFDEEFAFVENLSKTSVIDLIFFNSKSDPVAVQQALLWTMKQMMFALALCNQQIDFYRGLNRQLGVEPMLAD